MYIRTCTCNRLFDERLKYLPDVILGHIPAPYLSTFVYCIQCCNFHTIHINAVNVREKVDVCKVKPLKVAVQPFTNQTVIIKT